MSREGWGGDGLKDRNVYRAVQQLNSMYRIIFSLFMSFLKTVTSLSQDIMLYGMVVFIKCDIDTSPIVHK